MNETGLHPLKKVRAELNLSREDLAVATLLSATTIKRAENNEPLNDYVISKICEYISEQYHRKVSTEELGLRRRQKTRISADIADNTSHTSNEQKKEGPTLSQSEHKSISAHNTSFSPDVLSVGGLLVNLIVLARGHYGSEAIHCFYEDSPIQLPFEFERMKKDLIYDIEERKAKGETKLPFNGQTYKLKEFDTGYREIIDGEEIPVLRLKFSPTDYFTQMITDLNIGNPIRERYARVASITEHPVPEFASILGVNLNVITKDGYLILTERSSQALVAGGRLHTSVAENLLRPSDAMQSGAPDPFRCAIRGAQEELGITLDYEDIVFNAFTVIPDLCQYSLISTVQIQQVRAEIEEMWQFAIPSGKWESRRLLFYPHNPDSIAQFTVSTWNRWFSVALAAVILSLLDVGFTNKQIEAAFLQARSNFIM